MGFVTPPRDDRQGLEALEPRRLMAATPTLYAGGGGAYLTEFDPTSGAVIATITPPAGTGSAGVGAMATDQGGDAFVVDEATGDVLRVDAASHAATVFIAAGTGGLGAPVGLAVTGDGSVCAVDATGLFRYTSAGQFVSRFDTTDTADAPPYVNHGLAAGPDGLLYDVQEQPTSVGFDSFRVQRYAATADVAIGSPFPVAGDVRFEEPSPGLAFGADGNLYTATTEIDTGAGAGRAVTVAAYSPVTGSAGATVNLDGVGGTSNSLGVGAGGNVYVVNAEGGIDVRGQSDGAVASTLVAPPASGDAYGPLFYGPTPVPTVPSPVTFGGRVAGRYTTAAGAVTVTLRGPGTGRLSFDAGSAGRVALSLSGTTRASVVTIAAARAAPLADIAVEGSLGRLSASHGDLSGPLTVSGSAGRVTLGDLSGSVSVGGASGAAYLTFGDVAAGSSITSAVPIAALTVRSWEPPSSLLEVSAITAPSIGTLVSRGPFAADVTLSAAGTSLGRGSFGSLSDAIIQTAGSIGRVTVGDVTGSEVTAGVAAGLAGLPTAATDFTNAAARLDAFVQRPKATFSDSQIAAYAIGTAMLGTTTSDDGTTAGVAAHSIATARVPPLAGGKVVRHLDAVAESIVSGDIVLRLL